MSVRLNGSTSGYAEIDAPAIAGNNTLILPGGNGTADQVLGGNGSGTLSWVDRGRMTLATAQNTTSGTAIDFTGIPSWVKRITVMFNGVSTNGTSLVEVRLGTSSGVQATSYNATTASIGAGAVVTSSNTGFPLYLASASNLISGHLFLTLIGSNSWISSGCAKGTATTTAIVGGDTALSGTLDRLRITTVNGTDTFDAGSVNILYEG